MWKHVNANMVLWEPGVEKVRNECT